MQRLIGPIGGGRVAHVIVLRFERLARDAGDFARLTRLMERRRMQLHPVAEGQAELAAASGRMRLDVYGVFAQCYRGHIVETVTRTVEDGGEVRSAPRPGELTEALDRDGRGSPIRAGSRHPDG